MLPRLLVQDREEGQTERRGSVQSIELIESDESAAPGVLRNAIRCIVGRVEARHPAEHGLVPPDELDSRQPSVSLLGRRMLQPCVATAERQSEPHKVGKGLVRLDGYGGSTAIGGTQLEAQP